ncbi:MAG: DUF192 domain-containing protein [Candidatus Paceibacterota bacterium]|jgi:hypothetical protein
MKIVNRTKQTVLAEHAKVARTLNEKTVGLLEEKKPASLYMRTRWGIHMIGMKFPIDCVIFDDEHKVQKMTHSLMPGKMFFWNPMYANVVELPEGTLKNTRTELGDSIEMSEEGMVV